MRVERVIAAAALAVFAVMLYSTALYAAGAHGAALDEPVIVERVIKVEGTVEKPRVIFIVSRSKLWKGDFMDKSFIPDILRPVYPAALAGEEGTAPIKGGSTIWKK